MTNPAKASLVIALFLGNGYLVVGWLNSVPETNDVGRQWLRIIVPIMMVLYSLVSSAVVLAIDWIVETRKKKGIEPSVAAYRRKCGSG